MPRQKDPDKELKKEIKEILNEKVAAADADEIKRKLDEAALNDPRRVVILTDQQKKDICEYIQSIAPKFPSTILLTKRTFPNVPDADGRSKEGIAVKKYLAEMNVPTISTQFHIPKDKIELSDIQKEYIRNNVSNSKGVLELAKEVFQNNGLTPLHAETRCVKDYINELPPGENGQLEVADIPDGMYRPPRTIPALVWKINSYFKDSIEGGLDHKNLKAHQKRGLLALIGYINTYRFIYQINTYESESDRMLFESTFYRYTWDKPDLTQEECDQFNLISNEIVLDSRIQKRSEKLQKLLDDQSEGDENERIRIAMTLNGAIENCNNEHNNCVKRQGDLLKSLTVKRSDRLQDQKKQNASILNLVEMWKDEEGREQILKMARTRQENVKAEIVRISEMDQIKARIMGISEEECLSG